MVNPKWMASQLVLHEGLRTRAYKDTKGLWTIGVGYNYSARGPAEIEAVIGRKLGPIEQAEVTRDEAMKVLAADIRRVEAGVRAHLPEYDGLSEVRQRVCVDLAFNIGFKALGFKNCIAAVKVRDWARAASELYNSKWESDVGPGRAGRLANMLRTGADYVVHAA